MLKRFLISILAFVTVFMYQSQSWATTEQTSRVSEIVQLEHEQAILVTDDAPYQMAKAKRMKAGYHESVNMLWIASFFISGLGQILMGDLWRGLKYTFIVYGVSVLGSIATSILSSFFASMGSLNLLSTVSPIISLVITGVTLVFYVLNIMDAYNMSLEGAGMSKIDSDRLSAIINDSFKVSSDKAEMRVLAF